MISKYIREEEKYKYSEIRKFLEEADIRKLRECGILEIKTENTKSRDWNDLIEEEIQDWDFYVDESQKHCKFSFVGIIMVSDKILKCYPKYITEKTEPKEELKQIIKVLKKFSADEQKINIFNDESDTKEFNTLALQLYLLNDYYENGLYTNSNSIIETNGNGEIHWDRTINNTYAVIEEDTPYYFELQTRKNIEIENDFFKRLHKIVLKIISDEMKQADLIDLFELTEVDLTDEELSDLGETEYILYRIEKELNIQYNSRKQLVLKALDTYIKKKTHLYDIENFSLFGTNNFKFVWESVCSEIFDNKLKTNISELKLPCTLDEDKNMKLQEIIEKPIWSITNSEAQKTFEPDIISIYRQNEEIQFVILDAKYYNPILEKGQKPQYMPGVEDIAKQYLYQLAFNEFLKKHNIKCVRNYFLMPTQHKKIENKEYAYLNMLENIKEIDLKRIRVRMLPAEDVYNCYLSGRKMLKTLIKEDMKNADDKTNLYISEKDKKENKQEKAQEKYDPFECNIGKFKTLTGRNIYYYGEEFGDMPILNRIADNINTLNDLFGALLRCWSQDTIYSISQINMPYDSNNPTYGQSTITSLLVHDLFGGTIHKINVGGVKHYFNIINEKYIDLTKDQFDLDNILVNYEHNDFVDREFFKDEELLNKYQRLLEIIKNC